MKGLTAAMATASFIALALGACGNDGGSTSFGMGGGPSPDIYCGQFTSCSVCTPVNGCGWCYNSEGPGNCAADPDECATSTSSFSWTWNPSGCRVAADAGIVPGATSLPEGGSDTAAGVGTDGSPSLGVDGGGDTGASDAPTEG